MPKRVPALVNPDLLVWARENAGYSVSDAASKLKVKVEQLSSWEDGELRPSIPQLRKVGHLYRRPIAVFYLPERPKDFAAIKDYRRFPDELLESSPAIILQIRKAYERREIALELLDAQGETPREFTLKGSQGEDPEVLAGKMRSFLGLDIDRQLEWRTDYDALNYWRQALESRGALVCQAVDVDPQAMRGFSIVEFPLPVLTANIKDPPVARVFTLAHELVHVLLRKGGLCDFSEAKRILAQNDHVEVFCNRVAGAALVPRHDLLRHPTVRCKEAGSESWSNAEISSLASRYKVSREALVRRLLILDRTTIGFYRAKREEYQAEFASKKKEKRKGFAPPDRMAVAQAGLRFTGLVLETYRAGRITSADASEYLGVRLKHLPKIREAVGL